jgi:drug/metabolite transporter (DMT)-like permease
VTGAFPTWKDERGAAGLAVLAAAGFGGFFLLVDQATSQGTGAGVGTAVVVALAVQVGALAVTALVATRHTRACLLAGRSLLLPATVVGLLDVGADLALTVAIGEGPLSVVGPLGSLDPVVSVLLAVAVAGERLGLVQASGVLLAITGTVLVATA